MTAEIALLNKMAVSRLAAYGPVAGWQILRLI